MPLNENARVGREARSNVRNKVQRLLRSFYNQLLVEHVPSRILVTIGTEEPATRSSSARNEER
jgi:hypothetical protein